MIIELNQYLKLVPLNLEYEKKRIPIKYYSLNV